jgi:HSP20 family protein
MKFLTRRNSNDLLSDFFGNENSLLGFTQFPLFAGSRDSLGSGRFPAMDVSEDKENIYVKADVPGLRKEEIQVNLNDTVLTIRGERKSEQEKKEKNYYRMERSYGVFERTFDLGRVVDQARVQASYKDGVLELVLPKSENPPAKQIEIK